MHLNPADLPSRGCSGPELAKAQNWLRLSTVTEVAAPRASEDERDEENETRQRPRRTAAVIGELVRKGMS